MEDKPEKGIAIPLQVLKMFKDIQEFLPFEITNYPARALRALGLLLEDGAPTVGRGKTFWPKICFLGHIWALLVHIVPCWLVVVARGLYLARHLYTLWYN